MNQSFNLFSFHGLNPTRQQNPPTRTRQQQRYDPEYHPANQDRHRRRRKTHLKGCCYRIRNSGLSSPYWHSFGSTHQ
ncbi:hypothetical protein Hanom_Chr03g00270601 [Helianthus anomalus]